MKYDFRKSEQIDARLLLCVWGIACVLGAALRTVQLFTNIEPETGFFETVDWTVFVVYGILLAAVLLLAILPACSARLPASRPIVRRDRGLFFGSALFAVGLVYDAVLSLMNAAGTLSESGRLSFAALLFSEGLLAEVLQTVCGVLAAVYMMVTAISYLKGEAQFAKYRFLALMPLFWSMFRIVLRFMTKISFTMVSELLLELAMLAFLMLFLLSFARIASQVNPRGEMRKLVCFGLPASFLAMVIGISRFICTVAGRGDLLADGFPFSFGEIGFGVFAILYIFEHMRFGRPASEEPEADSAFESEESGTTSDAGADATDA